MLSLLLCSDTQKNSNGMEEQMKKAAASSAEPDTASRGRTRIVPFVRNGYRAYRSWRKARGRRAKARKRLDKMVEFYSQFIGPGDLCFDVGANLGNRTEAFLKIGARVVAVEPQGDCARTLRERFGDEPDFSLIESALAEAEGETEFFVSSSNTLSSCSPDWIEYAKDLPAFKDCQWDQKTTVKTTTLDALVDKHGPPVFCKIDVEGFEYEVLRGLSQAVGMVSLEYTVGIMEPSMNCIKHLANLGMTEFNYSEGESMDWAMPNWVSSDKLRDILTKLPGDILFGDIYARRPQSAEI